MENEHKISIKSPQEFVTEIAPSFIAFKAVIDKYPNVVNVVYKQEDGYLLEVNYDVLELLQGLPY